MDSTYDLTSSSTTQVNRSKVRLYARDTNVDRAAFSDEEWDVFIADAPSDNLRLAAAWGLRAMAVDMARLGKWKDTSAGVDAAADEARALAGWLESQATIVDGVSGTVVAVAGYAGGISISDKQTREEDTDRVVPAMRRNLHDHPSLDPNETYEYRES